MQGDQFLAKVKMLSHVAPPGAWDGIRERGLRTARQLVDAATLDDEEREHLRYAIRREPVTVTVDGSPVVLRDHVLKGGLAARLAADLGEADWVDMLNRRAFLFATQADRQKLLDKYLASDGAQDVLVLSPLRLLERAGSRLELADRNTGAIDRTSGSVATKSRETFQPISRFPATRPVREVTVLDGIEADDINYVVIRAERHHADGTIERLPK